MIMNTIYNCKPLSLIKQNPVAERETGLNWRWKKPHILTCMPPFLHLVDSSENEYKVLTSAEHDILDYICFCLNG